MPERQFLLGVDFGTTHCKALLIDDSGRVEAAASVDTVTHHDAAGNYYYLPDELWATVAEVIRSVVAAVPPASVAGIAIASMAESGVPLDASGQPLYRVIPYFDENSAPQAREIGDLLGKETIFKLTGLNLSPIFSLAKLRWLQQNEPEVFAKTRKWLCVPDYLNYRLTGEMAIDYSMASRTMAFEVFERRWSDRILGAVGMAPDLFAEAVPSGTRIGRVTREAARFTGLEEGVPVIAGGHDHYCGSLGAGLLLGNRLLDSSGTSESLHGLLGERVENVDDFVGFSVGRYVDGKSFYAGGGFNSSGISVDWIANRCASLADWSAPEREGTFDYETIMSQAFNRPPGANSLLYLAHLRGSGFPEWDNNSRGSLVGLRPHHRAPDLVRAVLEGVSFELRAILERLRRLVPDDIRQITTMGGGAKNQYWLQIKADVTGLPVEVPVVKEATALGAALLAGVGTGAYANLTEATHRTYRTDQRFLPNPEFRDAYDELFRINRRLYPALKEINRELTQWTERKP
jgi:xylulokinase